MNIYKMIICEILWGRNWPHLHSVRETLHAKPPREITRNYYGNICLNDKLLSKKISLRKLSLVLDLFEVANKNRR